MGKIEEWRDGLWEDYFAGRISDDALEEELAELDEQLFIVSSAHVCDGELTTSFAVFYDEDNAREHFAMQRKNAIRMLEEPDDDDEDERNVEEHFSPDRCFLVCHDDGEMYEVKITEKSLG